MIVTGLISASWYGWPMVFYLYGAIGILWSIAMGIFGYNKPSESKIISERERSYLENSTGHTEADKV